MGLSMRPFQEETRMKKMIAHRQSSFVLFFGLLLATFGGSAYAAQIEAIEFLNSDAASEILVRSSEPLEYDTQNSVEDKQVVLNIKNGILAQRASRKLDTSSFDSLVSLVSPFKVDGQASRLVVQLKAYAESQVKVEGNLLRIIVPKVPKLPQTSPDPSLSASKADTQDADAQGPNKNLDQFMETQVTKRFTGRPVTIQVRDAELTDVLRLIAEASGFNILVGDGVGGKVTLSLVDVPWDQALDVILTSRRLGGERKNNILRVTTLANLTQEKEEQLRAKLASERSAPRVTRIFPISYADTADLQTALKAFSENNANVLSGTTGGAGSGATTASIQVDKRTNSLIVQDTFENLEKIRKLIELLDTPTPQVLIEAKVVEVSEDFNRTMAGSLGFSRLDGESRGIGGRFNGGTVTDGLTGSALSAGSDKGAGGAFGYSPSIAFLPNINRLNLLLQMDEKEEKVKIVSAPKIVVLNKKTAKILKSTPTIVTSSTTSGGATTLSQSVIQANLSLDVTPTVTNAQSVLMNLAISRDTIVNSVVAPRNITSEVLVDSGTTLVIGGIFSSDDSKLSNGFPFLRDLPIVGWLFGGRTSTSNRSELFIFVTPKILGEKSGTLISAPQEGTAGVVPNQG